MHEWRVIPIGKVSPRILAFLSSKLAEKMPFLRLKVGERVEIPEKAYNRLRGQYRASDFLSFLSSKFKGRVLGVTEVDLYEEGLNFVFGEAYCPGRAAVISLARLRPEFYGEGHDEELFRSRALKEAMHELGHAYGLGHCPDSTCVMAFSNSIWDTDHKRDRFCPLCWEELVRRVQG